MCFSSPSRRYLSDCDHGHVSSVSGVVSLRSQLSPQGNQLAQTSQSGQEAVSCHCQMLLCQAHLPKQQQLQCQQQQQISLRWQYFWYTAFLQLALLQHAALFFKHPHQEKLCTIIHTDYIYPSIHASNCCWS